MRSVCKKHLWGAIKQGIPVLGYPGEPNISTQVIIKGKRVLEGRGWRNAGSFQADRSKEMGFSSVQKECSPANPFWVSDFQICKLTNCVVLSQFICGDVLQQQ